MFSDETRWPFPAIGWGKKKAVHFFIKVVKFQSNLHLAKIIIFAFIFSPNIKIGKLFEIKLIKPLIILLHINL